MVTLSSYQIWQIIRFILPPNKYGCVYAWTTLGNIVTLLWKIMVMLQNVCENCVRILEEEKHRQLHMFVILWKKWKKLASSSINQSVKSQKQCVHPRILLLWQKVCVKRHQHQFTVVLNNWTFRRHHWDEFYKKTLAWCHTKFNWFLLLNTMGFRFAKWVCDRLTEDSGFGKKKKIIFSHEAHFDLGGYVNKQNCRIWGT